MPRFANSKIGPKEPFELATAKASVVIFLGLLLGRITGYVRELVIAYRYGTTPTADAVVMILNFPDLFNNLLSMTTIGVAMFPALAKDPQNYSKILTDYAAKSVFLALVSILLVLAAHFIFGYSTRITTFMLIAYLCVLPNSLNAVIAAFLQFKSHFFVPSLGTFAFNAVIIPFVIFSCDLATISAGVLVAATIRLSLSAWGAYKLQSCLFTFKEARACLHNLSAGMRQLLLPIATSGLVIVMPVIDKLFASALASGSAAVFSYAEKLYLLPATTILSVHSTALIPRIFGKLSQERRTSRRSFLQPVYLNIFFSLIIAGCFLLFSEALVTFIYGGVGLTLNERSQIVRVLSNFWGPLCFTGTNALIMNFLFAIARTRVIAWYSISAFIAKIFLNTMVVYLGLGAAQLALATSLVSCVGTVCLLLCLFSAFSSEDSRGCPVNVKLSDEESNEISSY